MYTKACKKGEVDMACILGIDLGTSSVKAMLLDVQTGVIGVEAQGYDVQIPCADYAEQSPEEWWNSTCGILKTLREKYPRALRFPLLCGRKRRRENCMIGSIKLCSRRIIFDID